MRIVIVNSLYPPLQVGGAEKSVALLAEGLVHQGEEVAIISLHPEKRVCSEVCNGVTVYRLPIDNLYWPFAVKERPGAFRRIAWNMFDMWNRSAARRVGKILDEFKPDIVHTNNLRGFSVSVWSEARRRRIRVVHTLRDYALECPRGMYRAGHICESQCTKCRLMSPIRRAASHNIDAVVSNSSYVLKAHQENGFFDGVPGKVIFSIAGSKPDPDFPIVPSKDALVFGYIGSIEPIKGIEVVLTATTLLSESKWRLKIAGRGFGDYVDRLKREFPDPRIEWLGFTSSERFYSQVDTVLVSSVWAEPLPRTLIEAFAYDRSAITSGTGGIAEITSLGKVVGTYSPEDPSELAALMDRAIAAPLQWKKGGFLDENASDIFSESRIVDQYRAVYRGDEHDRH